MKWICCHVYWSLLIEDKWVIYQHYGKAVDLKRLWWRTCHGVTCVAVSVTVAGLAAAEAAQLGTAPPVSHLALLTVLSQITLRTRALLNPSSWGPGTTAGCRKGHVVQITSTYGGKQSTCEELNCTLFWLERPCNIIALTWLKCISVYLHRLQYAHIKTPQYFKNRSYASVNQQTYFSRCKFHESWWRSDCSEVSGSRRVSRWVSTGSQWCREVWMSKKSHLALQWHYSRCTSDMNQHKC